MDWFDVFTYRLVIVWEEKKQKIVERPVDEIVLLLESNAIDPNDVL